MNTATTIQPLPAHRSAEQIEALRDAADEAAAAGRPLRIFLATLGPIAQHTARATWARNFYEAGGVEAIVGDGAATPEAAAAAFTASGASVACICGADPTYAELAEATAHRSTDLYAFTSRIDERFDMAQKVRMIETMWRIAYADGHLSDHERHVMWRIADLLHVPQGAYVHARMRARDAAARP